MPKESKRRAKISGGGSGGGKARESGGREGANGGGSASAAKNSADANNWDGDDEAGILTAGAVRMLLKRGATNKEHSLHSFAGKYAPTLQLVGDIERVG